MRRSSPRLGRAAVALVAAALVPLLVGCGPTVAVTIATTAPASGAGPTALVGGATHTEYSVEPALAGGQSTQLGVLGQVPVQNQHLMGWGALNPEPSPGVYDWASLDRRISLIRDTGAEPVMTLCCAPDWMKGGQAGTTNWDDLAVAPTPDHVADFAALAAQAAARYPQVRRFQVWNEMKGFYDPVANRWDAVAYTRLYNAVYDAVKAVRPDALVGGPYAPLDVWSDPATMSHPSAVRGPWGVVDQRPLDVLTYWLANAHGADFVTLDGATATRDAGFITDPFTATDLLTTMTQWLRARTTLPIWWSEFHVTDPAWSLAQQDAVTTVAMAKLAAAGASLALVWEPQANGARCRSCLWSDPALGPVSATPLSASFAAFARCLPPGASWRAVTVQDPAQVFATATDQGALVVNQTAAPLTVAVGGSSIDLPAYGVAAVPVGASSACTR